MVTSNFNFAFSNIFTLFVCVCVSVCVRDKRTKALYELESYKVCAPTTGKGLSI